MQKNKKEDDNISNLNLDDNEILRLYNEGFTLQQIAIIMKCSKTTILNHLRRLNNHIEKIHFDQFSDTSSHKKKNIPLEDIINLHNLGYTDAEIAKQLNCRRNNITNRLNKAGIKNRKEKINNLELRTKISHSLRGTALGPNNPNYNINKKNINMDYYKNRARGISKSLIKEKIREQNYTCSICGKKTSAIEVHHIYPFKNILNDFLNNVYDGNIDTFS